MGARGRAGVRMSGKAGVQTGGRTDGSRRVRKQHQLLCSRGRGAFLSKFFESLKNNLCFLKKR